MGKITKQPPSCQPQKGWRHGDSRGQAAGNGALDVFAKNHPQTMGSRHGCVPNGWLKPYELWDVYHRFQLCLVVSNMAFIFHFIYGMSSFRLTFIFFKMGTLHHQPELVDTVDGNAKSESPVVSTLVNIPVFGFQPSVWCCRISPPPTVCMLIVLKHCFFC